MKNNYGIRYSVCFACAVVGKRCFGFVQGINGIFGSLFDSNDVCFKSMIMMMPILMAHNEGIAISSPKL